MQHVLLRNGVFRAVGVSVLLALSAGGSAWSQGQAVSGTVTSASSGEKLSRTNRGATPSSPRPTRS